MSKGAPKGNQNAKKEGTGRAVSLYLSADDMRLLRFALEKHGDEVTDEACLDLARKAARMGINLLLQPEYYETATMRTRKEGIAQKEKSLFYPTSDASGLANIEDLASRNAYEDAHELAAPLVGDEIQAQAHTNVDQIFLPDEPVTDDPEAFRAQYVPAYVEAYKRELGEMQSN